MSFFDAFLGSTPSQFAGYAILAAVISIAITIILTGTDMTVGNRMLLILFVILAILPSVFLMLLQITCMVTGGNANERWWCWLYSWVISIFVIIYCVFIVIISLSSLFTYNNAISKVDMSDTKNKMSPENSNNYAKMMIESYSPNYHIDNFEGFANPNEETQEDSIAKPMDTFANSSNLPKPTSNLPKPTSNLPITTKAGAPDGFANLENGSNMTPPATAKSPSAISKPAIATFMNSSPSEDEVEPFTNFNYASYN